MNDGDKSLDPSVQMDGPDDVGKTLVEQLAKAIESIRCQAALLQGRKSETVTSAADRHLRMRRRGPGGLVS
ncbi:hypothetical protein [Streptomyces sp. NPDC005548]|uniref:hypothetical protein n=1 Tax=Streptomyces sp. NPDC005548 TaxID=3364724 RepID=UPI00368BF2F2